MTDAVGRISDARGGTRGLLKCLSGLGLVILLAVAAWSGLVLIGHAYLTALP